MAFARPTGKHRAPGRVSRTSAHVAGVATLATTGVVSSLATPAFATGSDGPSMEDTGTTRIITEDVMTEEILASQTVADQVADQAAAQRQEAAEAAARAEEARRQAEERAQEIREARERAAREAERKRLAYRMPVADSYVSTAYRTGGARWSSGSHSGIDFHAAHGASVMAVGAGTVVEAGWGGAYGVNVVLRMSDGSYTQYGHLAATTVSVGQTVAAGDRIGFAGSTGNSTGPHLHFEARSSAEYGSDVDPVAYLRAHGVGI
ncbi:M23 family metallopeptidase [Streptomyces sp. NPDC057638]|uniref:M23 family metallopeptidase n=1 Tax=Streptomyces sp. NPDC057638 TaxID=3346190 RepID=UPI0036750CC0